MAQMTNLFIGMTYVTFVSATSTLEPCRPACPSPEAVFPHPQDCTKFFHCAYNVPFEKSCPLGLHFSPDLLRCEFPSIANCLADPSNPCKALTTDATQSPPTDGVHGSDASNATSSPHQTSPSVSPGTDTTSSETLEDCRPACPTPEALLAHPRDCGKYYQCAFSLAYEKVCPAGLYFSVSLALCDYPEFAQCTATEDAPCDEIITVAPTDNLRKPTRASQARVERDTLATIPSANGTVVSTAAPNVTLSFSTVPSVTSTSSLVPNVTASLSLDPNGTVVSTPGPESTPSQVTVCHPTCGFLWIFPHPWYCDKFFLCSNSEAIEMTCPEGLHFSEGLARCDFPSVAKCTASPDKPCL